MGAFERNPKTLTEPAPGAFAAAMLPLPWRGRGFGGRSMGRDGVNRGFVYSWNRGQICENVSSDSRAIPSGASVWKMAG